MASAAGDESIAVGFLRAVAQLWRCALPLVVAGVLGGLVDEWHHLGVSSWTSLCTSAPLSLATAAYFQSQLLVCSNLAMLLIVACQWIATLVPSRSHPMGTLLLGQGCCALAMLLALLLCPRILAAGSSTSADLVAMFSTDLLCTAAGVLLGALALATWRRHAAPAGSRAGLNMRA